MFLANAARRRVYFFAFAASVTLSSQALPESLINSTVRSPVTAAEVLTLNVYGCQTLCLEGEVTVSVPSKVEPSNNSTVTLLRVALVRTGQQLEGDRVGRVGLGRAHVLPDGTGRGKQQRMLPSAAC